MKKYLFLLVLFFKFCFPALCQELKFSHINSENGLSMSVVHSITQDKQGLMWFGTDDGLNKYDGKKILVYKNDPADSTTISDNSILSLHEDVNGVLWIGTNVGGLNAYDSYTNKFKIYKWTESCTNCLSNNRVSSIMQDKEGILWIGTDTGLDSFDPKTGKFTNYIVNKFDSSSAVGNRVNAIYEDKNGLIWIGTYEGGLLSFNKKTGDFIRHLDLSNNGISPVALSERIKCILEDSKNNLWIGTEGGLSIFNRETKQFKYYLPDENKPNSLSNKRVFSIIEDHEGTIWVGTSGGGLNIYDPTSDNFKVYKNEVNNKSSIISDLIRCVYEDKAGTIWIGTNTGGLSIFHRTTNQFGYHKKEPGNVNALQHQPLSILEDSKGLLWLGTYGGGISVLNRKTGKYFHFNKSLNLNHENILSLFEDKDSIIWIGSWGGGLNCYDRKTNTFSKPYLADLHPNSVVNDNITSITQSKNGNLWIGTLRGLSSFDSKKQNFIKYTVDEGLSSNVIFSLYYDAEDILWIATNGGGLNALDIKTGKIEFYKKTENINSISNNSVNCIYDDKKGNLWLGTRGGLNKFNKQTKEFTHYFEKDGLPNDFIYGVLGDEKGNLWISTNKGISRFNPDLPKNDENRFKNYFAIDGLQDNEFNQGAFYKSKKGEMFFGGGNGFNAFFSHKIKYNTHIPPIVITSFKKYGKESFLDTNIVNKKYIALSYKDNFFEFEFVALDYVLPSKNLYSFKMEGFDEDWTLPSTRNFASYTNLSGGDYVFRVRGSNNDGVWNEEGTSIYIHIAPPFYKTAWFYTLSTLGGFLSIFLFIRYRTGQIQKENKILEEKVQERTIELAQKNKDITSSIRYAKRIQEAILPDKDIIFEHFPHSFILFKPKDIVSGDFYWFTEKDGKKIVAAVDCTGHGVPGAFMSMIGHNLFNQIVIEKGITAPASILYALNKGVQEALKQDGHDMETKDGMDVALCSIDIKERKIEFAGAYRPLYIINQENIFIIDANKFPIGGSQSNYERIFTSHDIKIKEGDTIYMFSDGYADQFGGENSKKFMVKQLQKLLINSYHLNMKDQETLLDKTIENWKGREDQVDDILVIGIRFSNL